ncbi:hypothetical protein TNCV_5029811 [Trichonephila clavipes]|nr:hypothetical protein TNCV_5029811 [Trichonephila clavipes]
MALSGSLPQINLGVQVNREMNGAVPTSISGFKVARTRGDKDQWPNSNPGYLQKKMILRYIFLLKAGHIPPLKRLDAPTQSPRDSQTFSQSGFQIDLYTIISTVIPPFQDSR